MDCLTLVESLSQREKNSILHVLQREEKFLQEQEQKVSDLKKEIQSIRMCGVLKAGDDQTKMCLRCRSELGIIFNRGVLCPACRFKVCKQCQLMMFNGSWLCKLCYKQRQLKFLTGEWAASSEQSILRKWASGSNLLNTSLQFVPGAKSIDIDEPPVQVNKQGRKESRNGVGSPDQSHKRIDVPKDADQHKLTELFNVLRVKKPDDVKAPITTEIRRVTSRQYSESDSDSSSNSELDTKSVSTAPSVTESELDAIRVDYQKPLDSAPLPQSKNDSSKIEPVTRFITIEKTGVLIDTGQPETYYKPKPVPRSPIPAVSRKVQSEFINAEIIHPVIIVRSPDRNQDSGFPKSISIGETRCDKTSKEAEQIHNTSSFELDYHVEKTQNSLKKQSEIEKSQSQSSLTSRNLANTTKLDTDVAGKKEAIGKLDRAYVDNQKEVTDVSRTYFELSAASRNLTDKVTSHLKSNLKESKDSIILDLLTVQNVNQNATISKGDRNMDSLNTHSSNILKSVHLIPTAEDEFIQRSGSPYSFSMDSLPSSNPSPSLMTKSIGNASTLDSDLDLVSKISHGEASSYDEVTDLKISRGGDNFFVEETPNVCFEKMSKNIGHSGSRSPMKKNLSPRGHGSPQSLLEYTSHQDDSGHASGGSRGASPDHKRTDSDHSRSSLPSSTLSTVTDDEEDIDKTVAKLQIQYRNHPNLLTVVSGSHESLASFYSDAGGIANSNIPVTGEIQFSLNYSYKTNMLEVGIRQCRDIATADAKKKRSDPYVKTYLLPDRTRSGKRKTKVKKNTTCPLFDETLRYSLTKSQLENRTLWVTVWHNDRFGHNIFLGEVNINFDYYKFEDLNPVWYPLQHNECQPASMMVYKGDLSVSIRYVTADKVPPAPQPPNKNTKEMSKGQLEVIIKEARNLTAVRSNGFSDPFCKGYLLPERHKSSKQKTPVIKKNCNPVWNHTFIFEDVTLMELRERCLELTIWDYEKLASNDFLGGIRLNLGTGISHGKAVEYMDAKGEEMSIWQAMLDRPNIWIDGALILRPNMDKRKF